MKDLIFQDTVLAPYKPFCNKKVQRITESDMVSMLVEKYNSP